MSNFHLAHFSPEELKTLTDHSGDGPMPGTSLTHLKNLEEMMKNPHVRGSILHHFHDSLAKGETHPEEREHHRRVLRATGGQPALVGEETGHVLNHLMGGGQPAAHENGRQYHGFGGFIKKGLGKVAGAARGVVKNAVGTARGAVKGAVGTARGAVKGAVNTARGAVNTAVGTAKGVAKTAVGTARGVVAAPLKVAGGLARGFAGSPGQQQPQQSAPPPSMPAPQPQPPVQQQPQPVKTGGSLYGEERHAHGIGGKILKAGVKVLSKTHPGVTAAVKTGVKMAKKFSKSPVGKKVLSGRASQSKKQEGSSSASPSSDQEAA